MRDGRVFQRVGLLCAVLAVLVRLSPYAYAQAVALYQGVVVGTASSQTGFADFYSSGAAHRTRVQAADTPTAAVTWKMPAADLGATGILQTNGSGVLSVVAASGFSPPFADNVFSVKDEGDASKAWGVSLGSITTANTITWVLSGTAAAPILTLPGTDPTILANAGALKLNNQIKFNSGDAGIERVSGGVAGINTGTSGVPAALTFHRVISAQTGAYTASTAYAYHTNTGDTDGTTATLINNPAAGYSFSFGTTVAQVIAIVPSAGESLYFGTDQCVVSITSSAAIGNAITVIAATGGSGAIWQTVTSIGSWTCNDV